MHTARGTGLWVDETAPASSLPATGSQAGLLIAATGGPILAARWLPATPWWVGLVVVLFAVALVRPKLLLLALLLLIGARSGVVLDSLQPSRTQPLDGVEVSLVADPRSGPFGSTALAELDGERVQLSLPFGVGAERFDVGDRLWISGTLRGAAPQTPWTISQRLVGRASATMVHSSEPASGVTELANKTRDVIRSGVSPLSSSRRVLFTGLVFGDDRGQDVIVADNFRAAGLGHLLAVSGQNVVFVLLLASPLLSRFRSPWLRVVVALAILVFFGFLTRFEASVTRALVMAALALLAHSVGRPAAAAAVLPPAVAGLLLFDPLLAWSLAFQLSVAATLGLIVLSPYVVEMVRGPQSVRLAVAATISAQLFVAPLLFASFGQISMVAIPANLLAAPAAAGSMMWGLVAGVVAGVGPEWMASIIHIPTRLLLWWIDGVASLTAQVPVGEVTPWHITVLVVGSVAWRRWRVPRWFAAALVGAVLASTFLAPLPLPAGQHVLADGLTVARSQSGHDVVIVGSRADPADVVEALRHARLGRIDLVIATSGSRATGSVVAIIDRRFEVVDVWAPAGHQVPGARVVAPFAGLVGSLVIGQSPEGQVEILEGIGEK